MMNGKWKKYRVVLIAAGMAVCMMAGMAMGVGWSRSHVEKTVTKAADKELTLSMEKGEDTEGEPESSSIRCIFQTMHTRRCFIKTPLPMRRL